VSGLALVVDVLDGASEEARDGLGPIEEAIAFGLEALYRFAQALKHLRESFYFVNTE
jgi:hypothetical protein